jgi:hypothetical protein
LFVIEKFVNLAKGLFLAKRARPEIMPCIAFLTTWVIKPTEED